MTHFWNAHTFDAMFHLPQVVSVGEKILRPIFVYMFLVLLLRVFGKRELAQLNPFDLVVLLSLANTVQNAIIGDDTSVIGGMIGAFSLCAFNYVVVRFLFKHRRLDQLLEGTPTLLIEDGKICPKGLAKEMLNEIELTTMAHRQGFAGLDEIESCVLEPGGTFFIQGKKPRGPERRHHEISGKIDDLSKQVNELRKLLLEQVS
ncbi:MAG: putative rane protein [Planctomycetota bacterium]|nr:putative rane protein [Planctomycetota bacterium]